MSRREDILQAAIEVFGERGYHAASVREIGRRVGLLSGSLYAHISSKEDLLYEILLTHLRRALDDITPVIESDLPFETKLRDAFRTHVQRSADSQHVRGLVLVDWRHLSPERLEVVQSLRDRYEAAWDQILEQGYREGALPRENIRTVRIVCLSLANWSTMWLTEDGPLTPTAVADRFTAFVLAGMGAELPDPTTSAPR